MASIATKAGLDKLGVFYIAISAAAFASMAIFARFAYAGGANPLGLMILRFSIAAFVLFMLVLALRKPIPRVSHQSTWVALGMGAIGYAGQSMGYFTAIQHARAGTVALLLYLYPAIVALLAAVFLKDKLNAKKLALLALSFAGLVLTIAPWDAAATKADTQFGIALAMACPFIYSVYIIVGARFLGQVDPLVNAMLVCAGTATTLILCSAFTPAALPHSTTGWASGLAIAIVGGVVALITFFAGLERLGASTASVVSTVEPVLTIAFAWMIFQEQMSGVQLAGGVVILIAAALFARLK
jgi:drug/metabolite transporter (DMT)-like permease